MNDGLILFIVIGTIGTLIIVTSFIYFVFSYQKKKLKKDLELAELRASRQKEATLASFRGQENERQRISKDLHDDIGASLSAVVWSVNALRVRHNKDKKLSNELTEIKDNLGHIIEDIRNISHDLMPYSLQNHGLTFAIEQLVEKVNQSPAMEIVYESSGNSIEIPEEERKLIYRCVQEIINNALKHSGANRIEVQLTWMTDKLIIDIRDNGKGFDYANKKNDPKSGIGLKNIENRLYVADAKFEVESQGNGTTFSISLPLKK
jgi:signal transduction histidine kinase